MTRQVVAHGRHATFGTLAGLLTEGLAHTALAAVGLSAVLMTSATAYAAVRLVGAAYPVAIGAQTLWAAQHPTDPDDHVATGYTSERARQPMALRRSHLLGLTSNLTNP